MLGWNMRETKRTVGGLFGYASVNVSVRRNDPSSNGVSAGMLVVLFRCEEDQVYLTRDLKTCRHEYKTTHGDQR